MVLPGIAAVLLAAGGAPPAAGSAAGPPSSRAGDFEQAVPAMRPTGPDGAAPGKGPVSFRSGRVEAPRRFDLVGVAGEMRPVELRVRTDGGRWSDWTESSDGDPLYTGGSDELELRTRGWRAGGRLHYVSLGRGRGSAPVTAKRGRAGKPDFVTRRQWGADRKNGGCHPRTSPAYGTVKAAAIHNTVTANNYSRAEAPGIVLGICRYHRNANGWNDIGYNALVDRFGTIYEGRAGRLRRAVVGAQAQGYNAQTTGVAAIGTHSSVPISHDALRGFTRFLAWKLTVHGVKADDRHTLTSAGGELNRFPAGRKVHVQTLFGHGRVDNTDCPGNALKHQLDDLTQRIKKRMHAPH